MRGAEGPRKILSPMPSDTGGENNAGGGPGSAHRGRGDWRWGLWLGGSQAGVGERWRGLEGEGCGHQVAKVPEEWTPQRSRDWQEPGSGSGIGACVEKVSDEVWGGIRIWEKGLEEEGVGW